MTDLKTKTASQEIAQFNNNIVTSLGEDAKRSGLRQAAEAASKAGKFLTPANFDKFTPKSTDKIMAYRYLAMAYDHAEANGTIVRDAPNNSEPFHSYRLQSGGTSLFKCSESFNYKYDSQNNRHYKNFSIYTTSKDLLASNLIDSAKCPNGNPRELKTTYASIQELNNVKQRENLKNAENIKKGLEEILARNDERLKALRSEKTKFEKAIQGKMYKGLEEARKNIKPQDFKKYEILRKNMFDKLDKHIEVGLSRPSTPKELEELENAKKEADKAAQQLIGFLQNTESDALRTYFSQLEDLPSTEDIRLTEVHLEHDRDRSFYDDMRTPTTDAGAKKLIATAEAEIKKIESENKSIHEEQWPEAEANFQKELRKFSAM